MTSKIQAEIFSIFVFFVGLFTLAQSQRSYGLILTVFGLGINYKIDGWSFNFLLNVINKLIKSIETGITQSVEGSEDTVQKAANKIEENYNESQVIEGGKGNIQIKDSSISSLVIGGDNKESQRRQIKEEISMYNDIANGDKWNWFPDGPGVGDKRFGEYSEFENRLRTYIWRVDSEIREKYGQVILKKYYEFKAGKDELKREWMGIRKYAEDKVKELSEKLESPLIDDSPKNI